MQVYASSYRPTVYSYPSYSSPSFSHSEEAPPHNFTSPSPFHHPQDYFSSSHTPLNSASISPNTFARLKQQRNGGNGGARRVGGTPAPTEATWGRVAVNSRRPSYSVALEAPTAETVERIFVRFPFPFLPFSR
jgi:hypothetical protein